MSEIRAWIGSLGAYNDGTLLGDWFDEDELQVFDTEMWVEKVLDVEPGTDESVELQAEHEELWVMDHEGFEGFIEGECDPMSLVPVIELLQELRENAVDVEAVRGYMDNLGMDLSDWDSSDFNDVYCGEWSSGEDYAYELVHDTEDLGNLPSYLENAIDWSDVWRELSHDHFEVGSSRGVYIFRNY